MSAAKIQLDGRNPNQLPEMETLLDGRQRKKIAGRDDWAIRRGRFSSGLSSGVEVIELCNGPLSVFVLPTRGMGIWKAQHGETLIGWKAPLDRPVHPQFVNPHARNGLGWLDGFNELLCRCGLASNGPPGHDDGAKSSIESDLTLHGRIANLPARDVEVFVDEDSQTIGVMGVVEEATLFGPQLRMRSTISARIGETSFRVEDDVMNFGAEPTELELLYHCNFGPPFLEQGATLECPAERVIPRTARAAEGIGAYAQCLGPTMGYTEQVYFLEPLADDAGNSIALLKNNAGNLGVSLEFSKSELPCFTFWKCTQDERSGYVAGLEPGTNFPNFKTFERHHGRVIPLAAGETYRAGFRTSIHATAADVNQVRERIQNIQKDRSLKLHSHPVAPYCPID